MRHLVVGTAGHIDHGKSALVRALTGIDPDRLKEEKARGITIDLGFAHVAIEGVDVAFVDVPGHERFVKNMLAGATGIDAVLLVVAADESVMPQTREHFDICRLLGVTAGLVALTKSDLADADTIDLVQLEVRDLVRGSFLERAPVLPVSAVTGEGLDALRDALARLARTVGPRPAGGSLRLPIDRVFSARGFGTVVTGTLVGGHVAVDDDLVLLPAGRRVKVRGLQGHGRALEAADAGQRLAVNLAGVDAGDVARGDTLTAADAFVPGRVIDAAVETLDSVRPLRHGARVRFHFGTSEVLGRVAIAGYSGSEDGSDVNEPVAEIAPGRRAYVRVRLEAPAVVTRGDRFILRAYSPPATIAGGVVLDPQPPRGGLRTSAGRQRFRAIDVDGPGDRHEAFFEQLLRDRGALGVPADMLISRAGLARAGAEALLERVVRTGRARMVGPLALSPSVVTALSASLLEAVSAYHRQDPLSGGLPREEARSRVFARAAAPVFDEVVRQLVGEGRLVASDRLALPDYAPDLSDQDQRAVEGVRAAFERAGLAPPDVAGLAAVLGVDPRAAERAVTLLLRQKVLQKVEGLVFHAGALARLEADVRGMKDTPEGRRLDVAAFKQRFGVTRKFAIPLLEFLDRRRVTRRVGDARVVL